MQIRCESITCRVHINNYSIQKTKKNPERKEKSRSQSDFILTLIILQSSSISKTNSLASLSMQIIASIPLIIQDSVPIGFYNSTFSNISVLGFFLFLFPQWLKIEGLDSANLFPFNIQFLSS